MVEESQPLGGKIVTKPFLVLAALAAVGVVLMLYRYLYGLGAVTNLSDGYPWGIWITYDVLVGTALGCGGYAMALLVYIFNRWEYHPLVRSAVLTSVFGYTLAGVAIFLDIGRYWNGYHLFLPWYVNFNSVLVEVALCIAAYVGILWLELAPTVLEGHQDNPKAQRARQRLERWLPVIVALGILLPTMHQSSLGTLMIIAGYKLSPLWQTPLLPLLFLISAITMGFAITVFESILSSLAFKRPFETPMIAKVGGVMVWLIGVYLVIRLADLLLRGAPVFSSGFLSSMFILENLLYVVPLVLLASPAYRANLRSLFVASSSLLLAGSLYRFNAFLVGYSAGPGWTYFPALPEILITLSIVALELMGYLYFVKRYPVLPKAEHV
ncbi:MAG: Ni/Fe-hydrogenase cytochrome b subunit [Syntrophales bacterium]|nr:Ni/Fe-hydrogenase cytochrome b subunit [Syntrophales bacterium]